MFSLQLIHEIASTFKAYDDKTNFYYYSDYLKKDYLEDLLLDILIASAIQKLVQLKAQGCEIIGSRFTNSFSILIRCSVINYLPVRFLLSRMITSMNMQMKCSVLKLCISIIEPMPYICVSLAKILILQTNKMSFSPKIWYTQRIFVRE